MSKPLIPFDRWDSGTNQNSIPANDNSLRSEILGGSAVSDSVTAQPSLTSPDDDGVYYIIPAGATGSQWATFTQDSAAIFYGGTWYEFTPFIGAIIGLDDGLIQYSGTGGWVTVGGGGGGTEGVTIVTEASTSTMSPSTHGGRDHYVRAAGDVTFNVSQTYSTGDVFNIRATSAISILSTGVTLTPPSGGTLDLDSDMAVSVIMTSSSTADVIGQTVPL